MKRILFILALVMSAIGVMAQEYVDLGLPSGTLWKTTNEQGILFTYEDAERLFGDQLPTREQLAELAGFCEVTPVRGFFRFTGPNGNYILMPASGYREWRGIVYGVGKTGTYWSRTENKSPMHSNEYHHLTIQSDGSCYTSGSSETEISGHSVRLVQTPAKTPAYL